MVSLSNDRINYCLARRVKELIFFAGARINEMSEPEPKNKQNGRLRNPVCVQIFRVLNSFEFYVDIRRKTQYIHILYGYY